MLKHNSRLNNMIEQVYNHAKYQIILFRYVLDKHRKNRTYISKISDIFDFFEKIMIFSIPGHAQDHCAEMCLLVGLFIDRRLFSLVAAVICVMCGFFRVQLGVCVSQIVKLDFPGKWPGVAEKVLMYLKSDRHDTWLGALICLHQLVKHFEYVVCTGCIHISFS